MANEQILVTEPHPDNATELKGPLEWAFRERPDLPDSLFPGITAWISEEPEPVKSTEFGYAFRTYYFDRKNSPTNKAEAWTAGGQLRYTSGWWNNLALAASYYTSAEISADDDKLGTGLLQPDNSNINVLGEAHLRVLIPQEYGDMQLRIGRQTLSLPYVNKHDIRMLPATHEGVVLERRDSALDFAVGYLSKFKNYNSEKFVHMSEAAGAPGTNEGLILVGARTNIFENYTLGAINYFGEDTFDTFYIEGEYREQFGPALDFRASGQYTRQTSSGEELVGNFSTDSIGLRLALGWNDFVFKTAGTVTSDDFGVRKPWGGTPSYNSIQRLDFDRAGEKSLSFGASYNASRWVEGLSGFATIAFGSDAINPGTGIDLPDRDEYDITIDYKPKSGFLKRFWFRVRANYIDIAGDSNTVRDYRIIINYPFRVI